MHKSHQYLGRHGKQEMMTSKRPDRRDKTYHSENKTRVTHKKKEDVISKHDCQSPLGLESYAAMTRFANRAR
jgi:hypothetical protein